MTEVNLIEQKLKSAIAHHEAGRIVDAHRLYKQVLAADPSEADALHLLGLLYGQNGNPEDAIDLVRRAIAARPGVEQFHLTLARLCRAQSRFDEAITNFYRAIELNPFKPVAVQQEFGELLAAVGRSAEAIPFLEKAAGQKPTAHEIGLLGELLLSVGRIGDAVARLESAAGLQPESAELQGALGAALEKKGDLDAAESRYRRSIALKPDLAEARNNLGHLLIIRRRLPEAVTELRRAIELRPVFPQAHHNLALAYTGLGQVDDALAHYRKALEQEPRYPEAWESLGRVLMDLRQYPAAVTAFGNLVALKPTSSGYLLLSNAHGGLEDLDASITAAAKAVELAPQSADAHEALGTELHYAALTEPALLEFHRAMELNPRQQSAHSKLLYAMLMHDRFTPEQILPEHAEWGRQHTGSIVPLRRPRNQRSPDRRLRIGYISPNFRNQAVAVFVLPIFRHHDKSAVEIFAYSDVAVPDANTATFQSLADRWLDTAAMTDEQLAKKIREDRIDILVELTGHIGKGRLGALAYKPAPIQISYIGYQGTTGVAAVDYVLTDDWTDPIGAEKNYVEKPFRLPGSFFCYQPPGDAPLVSPPPLGQTGHVTFGCLNAVNKATPRAVALWAAVLSKVPGSKMMVLSTRCKATNEQLLAGFAAGGITGDRIQLLPRTSPQDYYRRYNQIDLALDPLPFNGHTTTCDAAWMGVPTITLSGQIYAHRYGGSVLRNLNLPDLVTESEDSYVQAAVALANDRSRLQQLRATLRHTMQMSLITDGPAFTSNLEQAYRQMWKTWIARST